MRRTSVPFVTCGAPPAMVEVQVASQVPTVFARRACSGPGLASGISCCAPAAGLGVPALGSAGFLSCTAEAVTASTAARAAAEKSVFVTFIANSSCKWIEVVQHLDVEPLARRLDDAARLHRRRVAHPVPQCGKDALATYGREGPVAVTVLYWGSG